MIWNCDRIGMSLFVENGMSTRVVIYPESDTPQSSNHLTATADGKFGQWLDLQGDSLGRLGPSDGEGPPVGYKQVAPEGI